VQLLIVVAVTALLFAPRSRRRYPAWAIGGGSYAAIAVGVVLDHRAQRQRLAAALLGLLYNEGLAGRTYKSEKGMPVMTPRTPAAFRRKV
jgi:hypothetical protein